VFINFLRQFFRSHRNHQYDIVYVDFNDHEVENLRDDSNVENLIKHLEIEDQEFSNFYNENSIVENSKLSNLQKALESLDPIDRELLLLRAQNYTYDEIAQMMNIENNQLKVKHHRAKTRLLKKIEQ
jgi:RNA polymerase sigma factor (sigma-70 family)